MSTGNDKTYLHYFGIRHHGPGCAKALKAALEEIKPDVLLIECPADAEPALDLFLIDQVEPPLAIMLYNAKEPETTTFYPVASFSPEWIALKYAYEHGAAVIPMDLPAGAKLDQQRILENSGRSRSVHSFWDLLKHTGVAVPERWWDKTIEENDHPLEVFTAIETLMKEWRKAESETSEENLIREAHMRIQLRKAARKHKGKKLAVVCGAYHLPALHPEGTNKEDQQKLKGLKSTKMEANWIPWSYHRLSKSSGYGAGVEFPAYYRHIFEHGFSCPELLFAEMAVALRRQDINISSARVIDASDLAFSLAQIRRRNHPVLKDIREAAISTIAQNNKVVWELISKEVLVGSEFGNSGPYKERLPLERDFQQQLKYFRLTALVSRREAKFKKLDLRKEKHLQLSQFLNRLKILGVPFGTQSVKAQSAISSFAETWELEWEEDFQIGLMEAATLGNTIYSATRQKVLQDLSRKKELQELSTAVMRALLAGLEETLDALLGQLNQVASASEDLDVIIPAMSTLALASRYGDVRNFDSEPINRLVLGLIPRVCIGLPGLAANIKSQRATDVLSLYQTVFSAVGILKQENVDSNWEDCLFSTLENPMTHPHLSGYAARQLQERGAIDLSTLSSTMNYVFSHVSTSIYQAEWLEGFLTGGLMTLFYDPAILRSLNRFVADLPKEEFDSLLPILRRSFSDSSPVEKRRFLEQIKTVGTKITEVTPDTGPATIKLEDEMAPRLLREIFN
ncbi:MAG: hypothetical protein EA411_01600 [Saprospirales bacterium]|nr:MAG: hypothetical protein EA411_01600 [Saprospirales bacterium]